MRDVLVTGATGFVGSRLVERLVERGDAVRCLVRRGADRGFLAGVAERVRFVEGDLNPASAASGDDRLAVALDGVQAVIHAGGVTRKVKPRRDDLFRVNRDGTARLLDACERFAPRLERFVLVSSLAAVGPGREGEPVTEDTPCRPLTDYGASKLASEEVTLARRERLPVAVVRFPAVYGPRDRNALALFRLVARRLRPAGARRVNFIHVDDGVAALLAGAERPEAAGETFHAAGEDLTLTECGRAVATALGVRALPLHLPRGVFLAAGALVELAARLLGRPASLDRQKARELSASWTVSSEKLRSRLGWAPAWTFPDGARNLAAWFREAGWM